MAMKLFELTRPEEYKVPELLRNAGYQRVGAGSFARVWQKPGAKYVVKVFSSQDKCYLNYLGVVKRHPDNPHFPRIIGQPMRVHNHYYGVRLEPLTRGYDDIPQSVRNAIIEYLYQPREQEKRDRKAREFATVFQEYPRLREALDLIASVSRHDHFGSCMIDIHRFNVMIRADGTFVFTDPVA